MSATLLIQPMQWADVLDIDKVPDFSDKDEACFREIRDVLTKYNALDRFGINLIHSHFNIGDDEVMVESTDLETRTHTIRPMFKADLEEQKYTVTNWKLSESDPIIKRTCVCGTTDQGHTRGHTAR